MRIGIYQRWLATLGGGERHTLDLAAALAELGGDVEILTPQPIDSALLAERLGIDAINFRIRTIHDDPRSWIVSAMSRQYDLFINATHGEMPLAQARHNIHMVFFPLPLQSYASGGGNRASWRPAQIEHADGLYPTEAQQGQRWRWTGSKMQARLHWRWPGRPRWLTLHCAPVWPAALPGPRVRVFVNQQFCGERTGWWETWQLPLPGNTPARSQVRLEIEPWTLEDAGLSGDKRLRGIPLSHLGISRWRRPLVRPHTLHELRASRHDRVQIERRLDSYQTIWSISAFSDTWVQRRWARSSAVLYPAIDVDAVQPGQRQPWILSVGRFFTGAHNKKHAELIGAFKALCDAGLRGWEYHLAGGCDLEQPEQREYLAALQAAAAGYPIKFHVNAPLDELHDCYSRASIFWHGAGLGEDPDEAPERLEHFGIATVEAMAAGCVPLVIDSAGQREIVQEGLDGLRWQTLEALQAQTMRVINEPALQAALATQAVRSAQRFHPNAFRERVRELLVRALPEFERAPAVPATPHSALEHQR